MKIVINRCYGGFGLSEAAYKELGLPWDSHGYTYDNREKRADPELIRVVEKLGSAANGPHASLAIIEIPDGIQWTIKEYDGIEWIAEKHRTWGT